MVHKLSSPITWDNMVEFVQKSSSLIRDEMFSIITGMKDDSILFFER